MLHRGTTSTSKLCRPRHASPSPKRTHSRTALRVLPLAAALLIANQALAQSTSPQSTSTQSSSEADKARVERETKTLDSVQVVGVAVARETTIGRMPLSLREIPQSVTVMDAGRIEDQNLRSLDDVMIQTPGIILGADSSIENTIYARGHEIESVQYDGMTTTTAAETVASPNMAMYEAVEVLRGSNGVLNGINGFGSVNMRRKRPLDYFQLNTGIAAGQWDRYHFDIDVTGPLDDSGRIRGRAVLAQDEKHYFYNFADFSETLLYGTVEMDLTDKTTLRIASHWQDTDAHPNTPGVPFYSDGGDLGLPRSTLLSPSWANFVYDTKNLFVELNHQINDDWSAKFMVNYLDTNSSNDYAYWWGGINRETGFRDEDWMDMFGEQLQLQREQSAFDFTLQGALNFWGRQHKVLFGANRQIQHNSWYYADTTDAIMVDGETFDVRNFDPNGVYHPGWLPISYYRPDNYIAQTGVFGQIALQATDDLTFILGARFNWWKTFGVSYEVGEGGDTAYDTSDVSLDAEMSPLIGMTWRINDTWSMYGSYTDYLTPTAAINDQGRVLDPAESANMEVGIKGELFDRRLIASFAVFRLEEKNRPIADPRYPPGGEISYSIASGETRSDGFEIELNGLITNDWSMNFGYTYNTTKNITVDSDPEDPESGAGRPFATFTPKHIVKLWSNYRLPFAQDRLSIGLGVIGQSKIDRPFWNYPLEQEFVLHKGGYVVADIRVNYLLNETWTLGWNWNNIFDKTYYAGSVGSNPSGNHFYGEPRNVMFTLRGKF